MSRLQLAINVTDLDESIDFYRQMFSTEPTKVRPGYANFAIENPPLKLVLFEGSEGGTINHLGVEVDTVDEVHEAEARIASEGLATTGVDDTVCCYAEKTETWTHGPDDLRWEWYVKKADAEELSNRIVRSSVGAPAAAAHAAAYSEGSTCCS